MCPVVAALIGSCSKPEPIANKPSDEGLLLNDDLVAIKENDGNITIKNTQTGEGTAEKIKFDWTSASPNDSLGVFCSDGKRGYYNSYTGKIVARPINNEDASLHIGAAYTYRDPKTTIFKFKDFEELVDGMDEYNDWVKGGAEGDSPVDEEIENLAKGLDAGEFTEPDLVGSAMDARNSTDINRKKYMNSGDLIGVDHETAWTAEIAGHWKGLRYEAAYISRTAHMNKAVNEVVYGKKGFDTFTGDGWYVQASYMLFGGTQAYDSNGAKYTRTTSGRKWGDLELAARFQTMDLNDGIIGDKGKIASGLMGGKANMYEFGLNYYPTKNVKIVLNYSYIDQDKYANGKGVDKGKFYTGVNEKGKPTKKANEIKATGMQQGVDYQMLALRFQVAF